MIDERLKKYEPFFGKWHISDSLGEGAFGKVYEIYWDDGLGSRSKSALKYLHIPSEQALRNQIETQPNMQAVRNFFAGQVERVKDEIRILQKCKGHSNIVSYEDHLIVESPGKEGIGWDILIRMELLYPISQYFARRDSSQYDVVRMWMHITNALIYCEQQDIIHRDIKPTNILVSDTGMFKLSDFGAARRNLQGGDASTRIGTEQYMGPEVYNGQRYDKRADYYSLGCVIYYYLNYRRRPFMPAYPKQLEQRDVDMADDLRISGKAKIPRIPMVSRQVNDILQKSLAYKPQDRYRSATDLYRALQKLMNEEGEALRGKWLDPSRASEVKASGGKAAGGKTAGGTSSKMPAVAIGLAGVLLVGGAAALMIGVNSRKRVLTLDMNQAPDSRGVIDRSMEEIVSDLVLSGSAKEDSRLILQVNDETDYIDAEGDWEYTLAGSPLADALYEDDENLIRVSYEDGKGKPQEIAFITQEAFDRKEKTAAAAAAVKALPESITKEDEEKVRAAEDALAALENDPDLLARVAEETGMDPEAAVEQAGNELAAVLDQEALDAQRVEAAVEAVNALPETITLEDEERVAEAERALAALGDDEALLARVKQETGADPAAVVEKAGAELADLRGKEELDAQKTEAAVKAIEALPETITVEDKDRVAEAERALAALGDDETLLARVAEETGSDPKTAVERAKSDLADVMGQEAMEAEMAAAAVRAINDLPETITLDDEDKVTEAKRAVAALGDNEALLARVKQETGVDPTAAVAEAEDALRAAEEAQKAAEAAKAEEDAMVEAAVRAIDGLPETITAGDEEKVRAAEDAVAALGDDADLLARVAEETGSDPKAAAAGARESLEAALEQKARDDEKVAAAAEAIAALPSSITVEDENKVNAAEAALAAIGDNEELLERVRQETGADPAAVTAQAREDFEKAKEEDERRKAEEEAMIAAAAEAIRALPETITTADEEKVIAAEKALAALGNDKALTDRLNEQNGISDAEAVVAEARAALDEAIRKEEEKKAREDALVDAAVKAIAALPDPVTAEDEARVAAAEEALAAVGDNKALLERVAQETGVDPAAAVQAARAAYVDAITPKARYYAILDRPAEGEEVDDQLGVMGRILSHRDVGSFALYADIVLDGQTVSTYQLEGLMPLDEGTLAADADRYSSEIVAAADYEVLDRLTLTDLPDGDYSLQLRAVDSEGTEDVVTAVNFTVDAGRTMSQDALDKLNNEILPGDQVLHGYAYTSKTGGYTIAIDADEETEIRANAGQIMMTGWMNARSGTSARPLIIVDGDENNAYTFDKIQEEGGSAEFLQVPRYLEKLDAEELKGQEILNDEMGGWILSLNMPFLSEGSHTIRLEFNMGPPDQDPELVGMSPVNVTIDNSVAVSEGAAKGIAERWEAEFPRPVKRDSDEEDGGTAGGDRQDAGSQD